MKRVLWLLTDGVELFEAAAFTNALGAVARWPEAYMPREKLQHEIDDGVQFWGCEENGELVGVMGIQDVKDVTLIRHAYVRTARRGQGIGGQLLAHLRTLTDRP